MKPISLAIAAIAMCVFAGSSVDAATATDTPVAGPVAGSNASVASQPRIQLVHGFHIFCRDGHRNVPPTWLGTTPYGCQ